MIRDHLIAAALVALTAGACQPDPQPTEPAGTISVAVAKGFGTFNCQLGPTSVTIEDQPDQMVFTRDDGRMTLERDHTLSDDQYHVATVTSESGRTLSVVLQADGFATVTTIGGFDAPRQAETQCGRVG